MKKIFKTSLALAVAFVMLFASMATFFADSAEAEVGSTLEYTLSIADSEQNIAGIHLELYFDTSVLKIKDINTDNLSGSVINDNQNNDGRITVVNGLINGSRGLECMKKTALVTVTFEVIAKGNTEVQYYIPYMYDYDMVNLYQYTLTQTVAVDGKVVKDNVPPVLADVKELEKISGFDRGDFVNTEDGKKGNPNGETTNPSTDDYKTFEYSFCIADATQKLSHLKIHFIYDKNVLKIDKVVSDYIKSSAINYDHHNEGIVVVSGDFDGDNAHVFKENTPILTLKFKVIGQGDTSVKYYISQMEDTDNVSFYNYTFTDKSVLDGKVVSDAKTPILAAEEEMAKYNNFEKGSFQNSASGKGSGVKPGSNEDEETNKGNTMLIICICAVAVVAAVVVLVAVKAKASSKEEKTEDII